MVPRGPLTPVSVRLCCLGMGPVGPDTSTGGGCLACPCLVTANFSAGLDLTATTVACFPLPL